MDIAEPSSPERALFRSLPSAAALLRRAGFRAVRSVPGLVEHQWTVGAFLDYSRETEDEELLGSFDPMTRDRFVSTWRERLERLPVDELTFRGPIAYVSGRRPA